jgi:iron(III) transport system substrate-binding protein
VLPQTSEAQAKQQSTRKGFAMKWHTDPLSKSTRRQFLVGAGVAIAMPAIITMRSNSAVAAKFDGAGFDLEKARKEGPVRLWYSDQEPDVVEYIKVFTEKTGIEVQQLRISTAAALPKLKAELRTGNVSVDVFNCTDDGLMDQLREEGNLLRYETPELAAYEKDYKSSEPGYWTTFYINVGPMAYDTRYVSEAEAPKVWEDMLDPRWMKQVGVQVAAAGSQYAWWYNLKEVVAPDFWTKLAVQKPRSYATSNQMMNDINSGSLKIGGKVSIFQYTKAVRAKTPLKIVLPKVGTPASNAVTGIVANTPRPEASKAFIHFLLSQEGQQSWNNIQGSLSARKDVKVSELPSISETKILVPTDFADYRSDKRHKEFATIWNKVVGF